MVTSASTASLKLTNVQQNPVSTMQHAMMPSTISLVLAQRDLRGGTVSRTLTIVLITPVKITPRALTTHWVTLACVLKITMERFVKQRSTSVTPLRVKTMGHAKLKGLGTYVDVRISLQA